jgi:hypothetical protein
MTFHDRDVLRTLRDLMARVDPDGWFIEPGLSNRAVRQALDAIDEDLQQLVAELISGERELQRLQQLTAHQCPHGQHCPCAIGSRHFWFDAFCQERDRVKP